jgi:hypothetical protein
LLGRRDVDLVGQFLVHDRALKVAEILHGMSTNMWGTFRTYIRHVPQKGKALFREGAPKKGEILCVYSRCANGGQILYSVDMSDNIFINCSWGVTWWQYTFTHKQYIEQHT